MTAMLLRTVLVAVVLLCGGGHALAQERILSFDSDVRIAADGSLDVTETIAVRAEGSSIRRGIYRDFPTRYTDRNGLRFVVDFSVVSLQRDGAPEPFFTERVNNGVRVNFGNDDFLPVPGEFVYTLRYRTSRQVGFFASHDELYWNATGHGWDFVIERASARIGLPQAVPAAELRTDEYTGTVGSSASAAQVERSDGGASWTLARPLAPGEGMTVVLGFPKGIVAEPTQAERTRRMLRDLAGPLLTGVAFLTLLGGYLLLWFRIGRDPHAGTIIPQYDPPPGHSPAGLRYLRKQGYDDSGFSSDIVALGVAGVLRIVREEKSGMFGKERWILERSPQFEEQLEHVLPAQRALAEALFGRDRTPLELKSSNATRVMAVKTAHDKALKAQYVPSHFRNNFGWAALGFLFMIVTTGVSVVLSKGNDMGVVIAVLGMIAMGLIVILFAFLLRQRTAEGRALLDRIEGLRLYLGVAERDELARLDHSEPVIDADRYQALLPFALALDVESAWTKRFTAAVGASAAEEAARSARWVGGSAFANSGFSDLGRALGSEFSSQISASASPPGSSSGGGGGGFSGGGGGGGGGGGR